MVALAAGIVGCNRGGESCTLTISSTAGGSVSIPGEGTFSYDAGTVVELMATPDDGYKFYGWTGDTEDIAAPAFPTTTITMNANHSIIANFGIEGTHSPSMP